MLGRTGAHRSHLLRAAAFALMAGVAWRARRDLCVSPLPSPSPSNFAGCAAVVAARCWRRSFTLAPSTSRPSPLSRPPLQNLRLQHSFFPSLLRQPALSFSRCTRACSSSLYLRRPCIVLYSPTADNDAAPARAHPAQVTCDGSKEELHQQARTAKPESARANQLVQPPENHTRTRGSNSAYTTQPRVVEKPSTDHARGPSWKSERGTEQHRSSNRRA